MPSIRHLLETKGRNVYTIDPEATVLDGLKELALKEVGALVVVEDGRPVGMFSERDYARKVVLQGRSSKHLCVRDIMTTPLIHVTPERSVEYCMTLMTNRRVRHLPVLVEGEMVGLVSIGDVVKSLIEDKEHTIEQLETYITSGR